MMTKATKAKPVMFGPAIIGFGDLLLRATNLAPEHKEFIKIISQAGKSLLGVIQDILDLTKIDTGKVAPRVAEFDLHQELKAVIAQFGSHAWLMNAHADCSA